MAAPAPIPLICLGRHRWMAFKAESAILPTFRYAAIVTSFDDPSVFTTLLNTLNPTPHGIIIGGGFDPKVVREVEKIVKEWMADRGKGEGPGGEGEEEVKEIKVVSVPVGTIDRVGGPAGLAKWIKEELDRQFGISAE